MRKLDFIIFLILFLITATMFPAAVSAESIDFNIDLGYDVSGREDLTAVLIKNTSKLIFYIFIHKT